MFLSYLLQNEADSDKNLVPVHIFQIIFATTGCKRFPPRLKCLYSILQNVAFVFCREMPETSWVHCFKFEVLCTLEILWFKNNSSINIYTLITTRCQKRNFLIW